MTSKESRVQNKEEIQGGRSFFLPGKAPAAIWLRGLLFKPLDRSLFVFEQFAADYFHQVPCDQPRWLRYQANLCSQHVLSARFTVGSPPREPAALSSYQQVAPGPGQGIHLWMPGPALQLFQLTSTGQTGGKEGHLGDQKAPGGQTSSKGL